MSDQKNRSNFSLTMLGKVLDMVFLFLSLLAVAIVAAGAGAFLGHMMGITNGS